MSSVATCNVNVERGVKSAPRMDVAAKWRKRCPAVSINCSKLIYCAKLVCVGHHFDPPTLRPTTSTRAPTSTSTRAPSRSTTPPDPWSTRVPPSAPTSSPIPPSDQPPAPQPPAPRTGAGVLKIYFIEIKIINCSNLLGHKILLAVVWISAIFVAALSTWLIVIYIKRVRRRAILDDSPHFPIYRINQGTVETEF